MSDPKKAAAQAPATTTTTTATPLHELNAVTTFGHDLRTYQREDDNLVVLSVDGLYLVGIVNALNQIVLPLPLVVTSTLAAAAEACDTICESLGVGERADRTERH